MNIQENIIRGILELLYKHDYLVLPGFGGFVLKSHASVFSSTGTALLPPSKKLGFNKQLRQNDGVLLNWLQNELACDHAAALIHLEEFADYCNSILNNKRRLSIERLGFFYLDFENNLCFEPRTDVNFLSDSFGLAPVHLKEIVTEEAIRQESKTKVFVDRPAPSPAEVPQILKQPTSIRNARKGLAYGAFAVFVVFILSFIVTSVGVQGPLKAAFFSSTDKPEYKFTEYDPISVTENEPNQVMYISTSEKEGLLKLDEDVRFVVSSLVKKRTDDKAGLKPKQKASQSSGSYRIVFGCFSVKGNASKYARRLEEKQYDVSVTKLNDKGLYVVALGGYTSKEAARSELNSIKSLFPHAWIKKLP